MAEQIKVDITVIGAGPGGYVAAIRAAQLGFKVAIIDKRPNPGGTCLNIGCIPSKALLHSSHYYYLAKREFSKYGIVVTELGLDLQTMMAQKDKAVDNLTKGVLFLLKKNDVQWLIGHGTFMDKNTVRVTKPSGDTVDVIAQHTIIATGSTHASIPGVDIDEEKIVSSTGAIAFDKVPESLLVIGAGYIGIELGSVWSRLGSNVTVVEASDTFLPTADAEVALVLARELEKQGMTLLLGTQVKNIHKQGKNKLSVDVVSKDGSKSVLSVDKVLVSAGRKPYTESLGLEKVGVQCNDRGFVMVDKHYATTCPGVYAIGDVIPGPMLAHKAEDEGVVLVETLAGQKSIIHYDRIPAIVYTSPEVAGVGMTEQELKNQGIDYKSGKFSFASNGRAKAIEEAVGFIKILVDAKTDLILGAHIIGEEAGQLISEIVLTMEFEGTCKDIALTCHAHPTHSEAVKEAALAVYGRAIHR